jgi:glycosyltransferase involved in cell wall biosynthesis
MVMPVYNEEECIADVVKSWRDTLAGLDIQFRMIVLNDGSRDGTEQALAGFADDDRIEVVNKQNSGHGPTILEGYRSAVTMADWVFQCDSDDEMKAEFFPDLWQKRDEHDALFGVRQGRVQNLARIVISTIARLTVRVFFGRGVVDINTPYRLIRRGLLEQIVQQIPDDTFAPNVIISGSLARAGVRICNHPVPHQNRQTGAVSIVKWKLCKSAVRAFWQTLRCRPTVSLGDEVATSSAGNGTVD